MNVIPHDNLEFAFASSQFLRGLVAGFDLSIVISFPLLAGQARRRRDMVFTVVIIGPLTVIARDGTNLHAHVITTNLLAIGAGRRTNVLLRIVGKANVRYAKFTNPGDVAIASGIFSDHLFLLTLLPCAFVWNTRLAKNSSIMEAFSVLLLSFLRKISSDQLL